MTIPEPTDKLAFAAGCCRTLARSRWHTAGWHLTDEQADMLEAEMLNAVRDGFTLGVEYGGAQAGLVCKVSEPIGLHNLSGEQKHADAISERVGGGNEV